MDKVAISLLAVLLIGPALDQDSVAAEVKQEILESFEYTRQNLKTRPEDYSSQGALEFWSSGGLLNEVGPNDRIESFEVFSCVAKHIRVIPLGEGVAVAHYYSEGAMQPKGHPGVPHYLTRASQVFVKEDGKWKIRSSHWSAVMGGSGTTQTALQTED